MENTMDNQADNNQELDELAAQLGLPPEQARRIATDIRTGDKLLAGANEPELSGKLLQRVQQAVDYRLQRRARMQWVGRVAAALLIGVGLTGLWQQQRGDGDGSPTVASVFRLGEEPLTLAELTLLPEEQDFLDEPMDDLALTELMFLLDAAELLQDDSLGKEHDHEMLYADGCDVGGRIA